MLFFNLAGITGLLDIIIVLNKGVCDMKKFLSIFVCLLFVVCVSTAAFASVDKVYEVAVIAAKGDAKVDKMGVGNWTPVSIGQKLRTDAVIKTGEGGAVQIVFDAEGLNVLNIKENTQITVKDAMVELADGSVLADFGNLAKGSSFTVKTPTAACAIRGSGMGVDFINGMTVVMAFEHSVYVTGLDDAGNPVSQEVTIPQGWKSEVAKGGTPQAPAELSENEQMIWDAWVETVTGGTEPDAAEGELEEEEDELDPKDLEENKEISPSQ